MFDIIVVSYGDDYVFFLDEVFVFYFEFDIDDFCVVRGCKFVFNFIKFCFDDFYDVYMGF